MLEIWSQPPNRVAIDEKASSGAPMRPSVGITRGTKPDRCRTVARHSALRAAMTPGPSRKVQLWMATSAAAVVASAGGVRAAEVLAERVDGEEAEDADEDDRGFEGAGGDEADGVGRP